MRKIIGHQIDDGPREHFIECSECGERLDMRDMGEVLRHDCRGTEDAPPLTPGLPR
jgi:hypothetical protein